MNHNRMIWDTEAFKRLGKLKNIPKYSDKLLERVYLAKDTNGADLMTICVHFNLELSEWFDACVIARRKNVSIKTAIFIVKLKIFDEI